MITGHSNRAEESLGKRRLKPGARPQKTVSLTAFTASTVRHRLERKNRAKRTGIVLTSPCQRLCKTRRPTYPQARARLRPELSPAAAYTCNTE